MHEKSARFRTNSPEETIALGKALGMRLKQGDVIGLIGELGTGKTWFTKGLAVGLGVKSEELVTSPSFTLVNVYEGRVVVYHMDAYTLNSVSEFLAAGLEEYFFMGGVAILEWADRWPELLPPHCLRIELTFAGQSSREILLKANHPRSAEIIESVAV
ncbi:MAG: tRNA (adenosine(37)-N6)-threonylcarbamoyltransferase complex ATPase subunit type 1 TsaE [Deltaproteobacteria bacterium]|nr:MAG: tRNA (adenosine(37)-N6)-threonylcarbamoyltransferase complex ATPase subunit type 1 TsaE [Deltaproteobacteria bacterium]